ncbi:MAG: hypothetical protein JWM59_2699 [Verrucomicrobiales bacterium]|nr:hypothetical protein [Verrucomicrobiales bacterium]
MTATEIRQLAGLGLNAEQLATVADLLDVRAAARPTSTARVRRWRERRQERDWEQPQARAQGFPPEEDTYARTRITASPESIPSTAAPVTLSHPGSWSPAPGPAFGLDAVTRAVPARTSSYTFTAPAPVLVPVPVLAASAPSTCGSASAAASRPMDSLQRHDTFHRVSETFHRVPETPPSVVPSPPPSLSPAPPIPPAPAPAPAHGLPPAPAGAHACAHEGAGWMVRMVPGHEARNQNQNQNQIRPACGHAPGTPAVGAENAIADGSTNGGERDWSGDQSAHPDQTPDADRARHAGPASPWLPLPVMVRVAGFDFDFDFDFHSNADPDPAFDPDSARIPLRRPASSADQHQGQFHSQSQFQSQRQGQSQGQNPSQSSNPDPGSGFVPRRERRSRHRAQAGPRQERRRRTPVPRPLPQTVPPGTPPITLETATAAAGSHGVTAIIAEKWWLDLDARGWTDSKGRPITRPWSSLRSYAIAWRAHEARDLAMAEALLCSMGGGHSAGTSGGGSGAAGRMDGMDGMHSTGGTGSTSRFGSARRQPFSGPPSASGQSRSRSRSSAGPALPASSEKLEIKYL